jgi:hypothetical protein
MRSPEAGLTILPIRQCTRAELRSSNTTRVNRTQNSRIFNVKRERNFSVQAASRITINYRDFGVIYRSLDDPLPYRENIFGRSTRTVVRLALTLIASTFVDWSAFCVIQ